MRPLLALYFAMQIDVRGSRIAWREHKGFWRIRETRRAGRLTRQTDKGGERKQSWRKYNGFWRIRETRRTGRLTRQTD